MGQGRGRDEEGRETDLSGFFLSPPPPRFLLGHPFSFRATLLLTFTTINENHRGVLLKCLVGVCCPVLNILTLFQTKNVIFRTRFQTWPLKSIPVFRPGGGHKTQHKHWHETEIMSSLLRLNVQQKDFLKSISNSHITLSFLFSWNSETTNTSIHHRSSFVNYTRFQTRSEQSVYSFFRPKQSKNPTRWGGTYLYGFYKGVPPGWKTHQKTACEAGNKVKFLLDWLVTVRFRIW